MNVLLSTTGWRRPIGCLLFIGHFPQKSPIIRSSFAKNDLQLKASYGSSPLCIDILFSHFFCKKSVFFPLQYCSVLSIFIFPISPLVCSPFALQHRKVSPHMTRYKIKVNWSTIDQYKIKVNWSTIDHYQIQVNCSIKVD